MLESAEFGTGVFPRASLPGPAFAPPQPKADQLYRVQIVLWTHLDPSECGLPDLVHDAVYNQSGDNVLGKHETKPVPLNSAPPWVKKYFLELTQ